MYSMIIFKTNQILVHVTRISCGPLPRNRGAGGVPCGAAQLRRSCPLEVSPVLAAGPVAAGPLLPDYLSWSRGAYMYLVQTGLVRFFFLQKVWNFKLKEIGTHCCQITLSP